MQLEGPNVFAGCLLERLFDTMFLETAAVESVTLESADLFRLDGVLHPELEKFEFEVPIGGNDEFVEVWMQYKLRLFEPDGELVTEWPVSGDRARIRLRTLSPITARDTASISPARWP